MQIANRLLKLAFILTAAALLWSPAARAQQRRTAQQAGAAPISLDTISPAQFRVLPLRAMVLYKGRIMTKSDFIAGRIREWRAQALSVKPVAQGVGAPPELDSIKSKFVQDRLSEVAAKNAALQAEFEKSQQDARRLMQTPQYAALAKEAAELRGRFDKGTPDDQAKIKPRAAEVYNQLLKMEKNGTASQP